MSLEKFRVKYISTKSQILELDLIVAISLFIIAFFLLYTYNTDIVNPEKDAMDLLIYDGRLISDQLVSAGYPLNWSDDPDNVIYIGLTDGNKRIMGEKLSGANGLGYSTTRNIFGITSDFYVFFLDKDNPYSINGISGFGKPGITQDNIMQIENPEHLIKLERLLFYYSKVIKMEVYVW